MHGTTTKRNARATVFCTYGCVAEGIADIQRGADLQQEIHDFRMFLPNRNVNREISRIIRNVRMTIAF